MTVGERRIYAAVTFTHELPEKLFYGSNRPKRKVAKTVLMREEHLLNYNL